MRSESGLRNPDSPYLTGHLLAQHAGTGSATDGSRSVWPIRRFADVSRVRYGMAGPALRVPPPACGRSHDSGNGCSVASGDPASATPSFVLMRRRVGTLVGRAAKSRRSLVNGGRSLMLNSAYIMTTTVVTAVLGFAYWLVAVRLYSTEAVGVSAALLSAMAVAALLANFGALLTHSWVNFVPGGRVGDRRG
jgi:hypothetical protein